MRLIPAKFVLTVGTLTFLLMLPFVVPRLSGLKSLDPNNVPALWDFPLPKLPQEAGPTVDELRARRLQALASHNLIDPKHELDHFYAALHAGGKVRVLHYGDSPTTADLITSDVRGMLQRQFGDAGTGFVLIVKPWAWYDHRGMGMGGSDWKIDIAGVSPVKDGLFGLGGASFTGAEGSEARWTLPDSAHSSVEMSFLSQPNGGTFQLEADGTPFGELSTTAETQSAGFAAMDLPSGTKEVSLRVTRGSVRLYGAEFRKPSGGIMYSSLGVNGANVTLLSRTFNLAHWTELLRHYQPDLVVLAYGTNESGYPEFVDGTWASEMRSAVRRLRAALPETSILLMSPMDRGEKKSTGEIDTIATLPRLVNIESRIAADMGVAFFNTFQSMGGQGTMARWYAAEPRLVGADYIHPLAPGGKIVGELLYTALRDGYNDYKLRQLKQRQVADR